MARRPRDVDLHGRHQFYARMIVVWRKSKLAEIPVTIAVNNAAYISASQSQLGDETMILGASNVK
jgi:hypothetical protein